MASRASVLVPAEERAARDIQRDALRKRGAVLKRWVTRMTRNGRQQRTEESIQLVQDPAVYVAASEGLYDGEPTPKLEAQVARAAFRFLTSDTDGTKKENEAVGDLFLACNEPAHVQLVRDVLTKAYVLEPAPYVPTSSFVAPVLRWATTSDDNVRFFIDGTKRIVVKMYPLAAILQKYGTKRGGDVRPLVDLANDIAVSYYLGSLVRDYERVATPHFAYEIDWFAGPAIDGDGLNISRATANDKAVVSDVRFAPNSLAQYVVVERADTTLDALFRRDGVTLPLIRALLFSGLFSLEALWLLKGGLHYDWHLGNQMTRFLANELDCPLLGRVWAYKRAGHPDYYYLTLADHGNIFLEIIDAGRTRILAPANENAAPHGEKSIIGNPLFAAYGIHVQGARADRSWDIRRLALDLLLAVDPDALLARAAEGRTLEGAAQLARGDTELAAQYKDFLVTLMGGSVVFLRTLATASRSRQRSTAPASGNPAAERELAFIETFWDALAAEAGKIRPRGRAKAPTSVQVFDTIAPIFRAAQRAQGYSASTFFERVIDPIFLAQNAEMGAFASVSSTSCLDHAFFEALRGSNVADEARASAMLVGLVSERDVLADPYAGDTEVTIMQDEPTQRLLCTFCRSTALGCDEVDMKPYCGPDCLVSAHNHIND